MPEWLSVSIGILAGLAIIALAIYVAVRPTVAARPPKPLFPASPDNDQGPTDWARSDGSWGFDSHHPGGGDGHGL
jgi:hypothetical protein